MKLFTCLLVTGSNSKAQASLEHTMWSRVSGGSQQSPCHSLWSVWIASVKHQAHHLRISVSHFWCPFPLFRNSCVLKEIICTILDNLPSSRPKYLTASLAKKVTYSQGLRPQSMVSSGPFSYLPRLSQALSFFPVCFVTCTLCVLINISLMSLT